MNAALEQFSELLPVWRLPRYPTTEDLERVDNILASVSRPDLTEKRKSALARLIAGCRHLRNSLTPSADFDAGSNLHELFGERKWLELREKLIRNAARSDTYFLPRDEQDASWSGLPTHAFVLFRYPLTAPARVLDIAADRSVADWEVAMKQLEAFHPMAKAFAARRPVKRCRLKDRFLGDLLSKYVGMYSRIGAPDLTDLTVEAYAAELGGNR
jgi:hypothetical protein